MKNPSSTSRLIGAALLLFVFFLPLHLHFSGKAHVTKECSCLHGTRAQLAPPASIAVAVPVFQTSFPITEETFGWAAEWFKSGNPRAPPSARSA